MRTLVIYATDEGQTEKISSRIAKRRRENQLPCDRHNIASDPDDPIALDAYDAVSVGSPMHYSHYDARLADYLRQFRDALRDIPSAFFSVTRTCRVPGSLAVTMLLGSPLESLSRS